MTRAYLKPTELLVGPIREGTPLTFVVPRTTYEQCALIFEHEERRLALMLDGRDEVLHHVSECTGQNGWSGILVPGVAIEVDPHSAHDGDRSYAPRGSLIRNGTVLAVQTSFMGNRNAHLGGTLTLVADLPACGSGEKACFTRWRIVLGEGVEKRVLHEVDVTPAPR